MLFCMHVSPPYRHVSAIVYFSYHERVLTNLNMTIYNKMTNKNHIGPDIAEGLLNGPQQAYSKMLLTPGFL